MPVDDVGEGVKAKRGPYGKSCTTTAKDRQIRPEGMTVYLCNLGLLSLVSDSHE